jgi:hypothetical protein
MGLEVEMPFLFPFSEVEIMPTNKDMGLDLEIISLEIQNVL